MESVIRGLVVYFFLLVVFRISGKRTISEATSFELVLLLIISETTQQAMVDSDHSITNAFLLIVTLIGTSIVLSVLKHKVPSLERWLEGLPFVLVEGGKMHKDRMGKARIDESDILEAARKLEGLERLEQVKYAVVERGGEITIVPVEARR